MKKFVSDLPEFIFPTLSHNSAFVNNNLNFLSQRKENIEQNGLS